MTYKGLIVNISNKQSTLLNASAFITANLIMQKIINGILNINILQLNVSF